MRCYKSAVVWLYPKDVSDSKCLSERINWIISRIPHRILKIIFVQGSMNSYQCWKVTLERPHFLKVQSGKITVWSANVCKRGDGIRKTGSSWSKLKKSMKTHKSTQFDVDPNPL
jgi:hypothetical protein